MASIRERVRKDGTTTWAVLWRDADTGKQTSRTMPTSHGAQELVAFLNANGNSFALAAQAAGKLRSTAPPVSTVVLNHIEGLTGIIDGTRRRYRNLATNHITASTIGPVPVDQLTRREVATWLNNIDRAVKTKRNIHSLLSAALSEAVEEGLVDMNVAHGIKFPKTSSSREPVFLTREDVDLIANTVPERYSLLIRLLAGTGLRWSEATALRISDVSFTPQGGTLSVTRAWKQGTKGWELGGPKTRRGRRTVTMPKALASAMATHCQGRAGDEFVFQTWHGGPVMNYSFHRDVWQPAMRALKDQLLVQPRIHDLRHTHASWLISAGVPLTVIQRRLGHESIKTTSDTYGHLADDADQAAAAALN